MKKVIDLLNENLSKEIHAAVKKVAKTMEAQQNKQKMTVKQSLSLPSFDQQLNKP